MATSVPPRHPFWLRWTTLAPILALIPLPFTWGQHLGPVWIAVVAVLLIGSVLAAVQHAEAVAHKVGEPFGSLVLAVAVTVIEVALIVTLMVSGGDDASTLARDTVFAAVMITCNGIVGASLLAGSIKHDTVNFNVEGTATALASVATLATVCLVLPSFTLGAPGPEFTGSQLIFAAVCSLVIYGLFVVTQTTRHRDFFLPVDENNELVDMSDDHAEPPSTRSAWASFGLLLVSLVAVVGLAKVESKPIEEGVAALGFPHSFVGVIIAMLVLLPESLSAVNAARRDRVQISLNLAYGSAMASIGLTIPVIALASIWLPVPLHLGLGSMQIVMLALTVAVGILTVVPGRATRMQGALHLWILFAFVFLAANP
ncbi:calcium:proton antiporter [Branchiibius cervicis]|uniref:Calcium:proton antiporter n=1 Tax=Branchiibius cervicis TaxID=908252 RepID=A0ABW2ANH5_9MICO